MKHSSFRNSAIQALACVCLMLVAAPASAETIPVSPSGRQTVLDRKSADAVITDVFGLVISDVTESPETFVYRVSGFSDSRRCPLQGIRDLNCDEFQWEPSMVTIHRAAWDGPVSGHLSRNRIVLVDLESDSVGFAVGTMQGVLVMPSSGMSAAKAPAFGWYLSRSGRSLSMSVRDVSGDGIPDVVYTYSQMLPRGVSLVVQDVWTFVDMTATKYISSGEKLSGVLSSTFEGVPVFLSSDSRVERGRFVYRPVYGIGSSTIVVVERSVASEGAIFPGWEYQVIGDLGNGWTDFLAVQGTTNPMDSSRDDGASTADGVAADGVDAPEGDRCTIADVPADAPVAIRRYFLDLEEVCRIADGNTAFRALPVRVGVLILKGFGLAGRGYPVLASTFFEAAAVELDAAGFKRAAVVVSMAAAMGGSAAVEAACGSSAVEHCSSVGFSSTQGLVCGRLVDAAGDLVSRFAGALADLERAFSAEPSTEP